MNISSKRAEYIALIALGLSIAVFVFLMLIGFFCGASAATFLAWQTLSGVLIWFVLVIQFHQQTLAEREKLDMAQLEKSASSDTIFQSDANRTAMFAAAQKQLALFEKWFIPIFGIFIAAFQIGIGLFTFFSVKSVGPLFSDLRSPQLHAVFMVIIAFVCFLFSRYATGTSNEKKFKPLRAGGSSLLATAILSFAFAISLALAQFKIYGVLTVVSWAIPILLIVLGIETALNAILDIYRPRLKGQYARSAFDSRLLGAFNEPGGILHTFSSAIDYQFGFKVSQTWFYKLLAKAIVPLVIVGALALYSLSCVVIVGPGEQALVEHLGAFDRIAEPGITFKLPYPFDIAYIHPTTEVQQVNIGFVEATDDDEYQEPVALLWGEKHYAEEYHLLVATEGQTAYDADDTGAVPVSIVIAAVPVQYKINDLKTFLYNHVDAKAVLETICYRQLTRYASSATIETNEGDSQKLSLLGAGRKPAADSLKESIQADANEAGLGIDIVFLGLQGVHPPSEVAVEYQKVIGAVQTKQALILAAQALRNKKLTLLGGSVSQVSDLYDLAEKYQQAQEADDEEASIAIGEKLDAAFANSGGDIYKTLAQAKGYAYEKATLAKAVGERFADQLKAYEASPDIYKRILWLKMFEESLKDTRKYIILVDEKTIKTGIIDLQEKLAPSLYDLDLESLKEN